MELFYNDFSQCECYFARMIGYLKYNLLHMYEIWPIGRRGNPVYLEKIPEELAASLELLSERARVARAAFTVLAAHPNQLHGPSELLAGIREVFGRPYTTQSSSLHQVLREATDTLFQQGIILPIR